MQWVFLLLIWVVCRAGGYAQTPIASPQIIHYTSSQYQAGMQNWAIQQDSRGIIYVGNNEGLLTFNGRYYAIHHLPNRTVVRSIGIGADNRIFVGGQDELGYFSPNANGILTYHSLLPLLPVADRGFADVWSIEVVGKDVFFRTMRQLMHLHDGKLDVVRATQQWSFMGQVKSQVFAQDGDRGLVRFTGGRWQVAHAPLSLSKTTVTSVLPYGRDSTLVTTLTRGLFVLHNNQLTHQPTPIDPALRTDRIYCAVQLSPSAYALGTTSAGVLIINRQGQLIQTYSSPKELQNANVRAIRLDQQRNMWLALDDGIDFVAINSPFKYIHPDGGKNATGYAMRLHGKTLYAGTANGLYASQLDELTGDLGQAKGHFEEVAGTKGQVWRLDVVDNQLLMSHEMGLFAIQNQQATTVYSGIGTWLTQPISTTGMLAGTYQGLRSVTVGPTSLRDQGVVGTSRESLRFISVDRGHKRVWASHPNRGVFRIDGVGSPAVGQSTKLYTDREGLPSTQYNYVYTIQDQLMVATEKGIYDYDSSQDRFVPSPRLTPILGQQTVQYLHEDQEGNIWFASQKRVGVIDFGQGKTSLPARVVYFPELTGKLVGGFEFIQAHNLENIFVGTNRGFTLLNYQQYRTRSRRPDVLLGRVSLTNAKDSVLFGGYTPATSQTATEPATDNPLRLPAPLNSLHFEFTSTLFDQSSSIEFSYRLIGADRDWSPWSSKSDKDYTNLPWGDYTFAVKSRNNLGNESPIVYYAFHINPAWYESYWAWLVYILVFGWLLYQGFKWQRHRHQTEQEQLTYLHQLELDRNEKEMVRLRNEKLEADMDFKNRELASMTMQLAQRGEVLVKVKEVVAGMAKKQDTKEIALNFRQVLRLIRNVETKDADWGQFTLHFNAVNEAFFHALQQQYPELTPNDLKLCAFLKMNLSSKEIAQFMNITSKAVEISRYRLRKKLRLESDVNLYTFLANISKDNTVKNIE
ncbi:triple tyrosine motif-containing protein [Spirosoma pomorum]